MDWLELAARSEWPIVVGGSIIIFRKQIAELIAGLRPTEFKGFGVEAKFERSLLTAEILSRVASVEAALTERQLATLPLLPEPQAPKLDEPRLPPPASPSEEVAGPGHAPEAEPPQIPQTMPQSTPLSPSVMALLQMRTGGVSTGSGQRDIIREAYHRLEKSLIDLAYSGNSKSADPGNPTLEDLVEALDLSALDRAILAELKSAATSAQLKRESSMSPGEADRFVSTASNLALRISHNHRLKALGRFPRMPPHQMGSPTE